MAVGRQSSRVIEIKINDCFIYNSSKYEHCLIIMKKSTVGALEST